MCESKRQSTEMWPQLERIWDILRLAGRMASSLSDELDYTGFNAPAVKKIADTFAELFASSAKELREISKATATGIPMETPEEVVTGFEDLPQNLMSLTLEEIAAKFETPEKLGQYIQMLKDLRDACKRDQALRERKSAAFFQALNAYAESRQAELKQDTASEGCSLPDSHRNQDNGQGG